MVLYEAPSPSISDQAGAEYISGGQKNGTEDTAEFALLTLGERDGITGHTLLDVGDPSNAVSATGHWIVNQSRQSLSLFLEIWACRRRRERLAFLARRQLIVPDSNTRAATSIWSSSECGQGTSPLTQNRGLIR